MPAPATQKRLRTSKNAKKQHSASRPLAELSTERQIQNSICEILDYLKLPYSVTDASRVYGVDGRVRRSKVATGWPDITGCLMSGRFFCIEVKKAKGRLSEEQSSTLARLRTAGAAVCVAHSVEEAVEFLYTEGDLKWQQQSFLSRWQSAAPSSMRSQQTRKLLK
jgi:ribosome biogenesis protein Nip4